MSGISKLDLSIPQDQLSDLKRRLETTRWPDKEPVRDWSQGVPLARMQEICEYWAAKYDWRRCEAMLNGFGLYETVIDGLRIRFLHVRSPQADALPMIMTHGWPGSIIEFHKVTGPLADPVAHGGSADQAFHLVIPCLPGYGFSDRPTEPGCNVDRIAAIWQELMARLGYDSYVAQGGDWGSIVTIAMGKAAPPQLAAIHINQLLIIPFDPTAQPDSEDHKAALDQLAAFSAVESGYAVQQSTRPQTLGYGLADSPIAQASWIYEKFRQWADCDGDPANIFTLDELLDNIMLYWLSNTGASSARLYWESSAETYGPTHLHLPVGCSIFPKENLLAKRSLADRYYHNIVHWNELEKGGHFAALEQPEVFVNELRTCFAQFR